MSPADLSPDQRELLTAIAGEPALYMVERPTSRSGGVSAEWLAADHLVSLGLIESAGEHYEQIPPYGVFGLFRATAAGEAYVAQAI